MRQSLRLARILSMGLVLIFAAGSASAALFTVTMSNGTSFETRYRPMEADWDDSKVMIRTDTGNFIAIAKSEIVGVESDVETSGFGYQVNATTKFLGWSPNDVGGDEEEGADGEVQPTGGQEPEREYLYGDEDPGSGYSFDQFLDIPAEGQALGGGINLDAAIDG